MKFIFALMLSLSFTSAFAGGQTGSGMNGCWVKVSGGFLGWRSIEELMYPEMIIKRPQGTGRNYGSNTPWFYIPKTRYYDMTKRYYAVWSQRRLSFIEKSHPKSYHIFKELYQLLTHVQVSNLKLNGLFKAEVNRSHRDCKDFSPAMMTFKNGSIVVFKPVFEKLDPLSAQILYIHETIRFAQAFHPVFHDLSDSDLQRLTSLFFLNTIDIEKFDSILRKYEDRLVKGTYKVGAVRSELSEAERQNSELVFRNKFQEMTYLNDENLGAELNELRINDTDFKERSYQETVELLRSANRQIK